MDFLVLLSVFAITQTIVLARPSDTNFKTKRSAMGDPSKIFKPSSIKFPIELENGFTVIINGTLDTKSDMLEVIFPSRSRTENQCRITYDFKTSMLDMFPDGKAEPYRLDTTEDYPTFSIKLTAWTGENDLYSFKFYFEGNNGGESVPMICHIARYDDFERIEFAKGVHTITSLFFEF